MKVADLDSLALFPLNGRDRPSAPARYSFLPLRLGTVEVFESPAAPTGLFMISALNGGLVGTMPYSH